MKDQATLQKLLRERFAEAQQTNPRYSLRAFSKRVGVHFAALSAILNGKRNVSRKIAARIADGLCLDPQERSELLGLFPEPKSAQRRMITDEYAVQPKYLELDAHQFKLAAEWEHFAVMSLMHCSEFQSSTSWISNRLGITLARAEQVLDRLVSLNLVSKGEDGNLIRTGKSYRTPDDMENVILKKAHDQTLELARNSLYKDAVTHRDFTSVTVAVNPKNIHTAKELIRKFQDELCDKLEDGEKSEVYRLSVQLFPLTTLTHGTNQ